MSERMAVIEAFAHACAFRFVLRDDICLEHDATRYSLCNGFPIVGDERFGVVHHPEEEVV